MGRTYRWAGYSGAARWRYVGAAAATCAVTAHARSLTGSRRHRSTSLPQAIAGYDPTSRALIGLGIAPGQVARTLVRVDAAALSLNVTGNIPDYLIELGPIATLDVPSRVLYWMGIPSAAGPDGDFYIVGVSVADASIASASSSPLACEPWSLWFHTPPANARQ